MAKKPLLTWLLLLLLLLAPFPAQSFAASFPRVPRPPRNSSSSSSSRLRLNKALSSSYSRRAADVLIASGSVSVNGVPVTTPVFFVDASLDVVSVSGVVVPAPCVGKIRREVYKLWKPEGVECTESKKKGDGRTLADLLGSLPFDVRPSSRLFPLGRLDKDSSGLLLLTNDGSLNDKLLRPAAKRPKEYLVTLLRAISDSELSALSRGGLRIPLTVRRPSPPVGRREGVGGVRTVRSGWTTTEPCSAERVNAHVARVTITEGKNRQIRNMCEAVGHVVAGLKRVNFCGVGMEGLKRAGDFVPLTKKEIKELLNEPQG